jgi:uncharacterized membrane protein YeaQ/YmgE (transglycosylase-associated protein family)
MGQGMGLISWIVMGALAGLLGKFLTPGKDPGGCIITPLIGIVGAVVGGFIATSLGFGGLSGFDLRSLAIATAGAILFLLVLRLLRR